MRPDTRHQVEAWWCDLFELRDTELWSNVTVLHPHGMLDDYEGWYVAWREDGVHVSAPSTAEAHEVASLRAATPVELQSVAFWHAFANQRGAVVLGPSTHHYLDVDPGGVDDVVELSAEDLELLRPRMTTEEWSEGGMDHAEVAFGLCEDGVPVAAAVLDEWRGCLSDIGVAVAATHRGRGLATRVAGRAASYAVREHGIARWRALTTNVPSTRTAQRLGFEPYATQLAIRRGSSGA